MDITVYGSGYVGLVTAACFAEMGNRVVCVDIDGERVRTLASGQVPIREPGLDDLVAHGLATGNLRFTTDPDDGVAHGLFQLIAVGTPAERDGSADLTAVFEVADRIGRRIEDYRVVVTKSTVPVGTAERIRDVILERLAERRAEVAFDVASNPEFLKEGGAVEDFMKPDRVIVGTDSDHAASLMDQLYAPFNRQRDRTLVMDPRSAELTKYAANAMLATKITAMNEFASIAERVGADIEHVRQGIGSDPRIGYHFIYPGAGYGGSCFPKDVGALTHVAEHAGYTPRILNAVQTVNESQKHRPFERLREHFGDDLSGRVFAMWGLAFKPGTDDMREASSRVVMEALWRAGARVRAFDPAAMERARELYPDATRLELCPDPMTALDGADALIVMTEWHLFRSPDLDEVARRLATPVIVDGRNLYDPELLAQAGFDYYCIGRPVARGALARRFGSAQ